MSLTSPVCEGKEPRGHACKRLIQAAKRLSKCYSVMSLVLSSFFPLGLIQVALPQFPRLLFSLTFSCSTGSESP